MIVKIQSDKIELNSALETHIQRKINIALSRIEPYITSISISLCYVQDDDDRQFEYRKPATQCLLKISIENLPAIEVVDIQTDLYCAIDRVIQKASRTMSRKLFSTTTADSQLSDSR
ncbi:MAG: HPF/RaiA family ribosome-associated protein [Enterobacterales bacterium]|nr:HPF/RaiA family ribosome-associated protein [Enterobacterales bacterium]